MSALNDLGIDPQTFRTEGSVIATTPTSRFVVAGDCLAVVSLNLSAKVITAPCNDPTYFSDWSCTGFRGDGTSWFLRILSSNFFLDFGFIHTDSLFLHNVSLLDADVDDVHW